MSRLTSAEYYRRHRFLRFVWQRYQNLFALIPIDQQYDLHNFYLPDKFMTKDDLVAYRKDIKQADGGLAARAYRAYARINQVYKLIVEAEKKKKAKGAEKVPEVQRPNRKYRNVKSVKVKAVVRPEVDWDRFAFALLQHVKTLSKPRLKPKRQKDEDK